MKTFTVRSITAAFILLICGIITAPNAAQWISFSGVTEGDYEVTVLSSDNSSTILQIDLQGMFVEEIRIDNQVFHE